MARRRSNRNRQNQDSYRDARSTSGSSHRSRQRTPRQPIEDSSEMDFNKGKMVMHVAKTTYTTLIRSIVECVQNALDANAHEIWLAVDVKTRSISVADNGDGVTRQQFEEALLSVGHGVKSGDKLGRFGLGLVSPLDKCEYFTFTSKPKSGGPALRWTFKAKDIEVQGKRLSVPCTQVRTPNGNWTTVLRIHNFTRDRQTSALDPDRIAEGVQEKLGPAMRKAGVVCNLRFRYADGNEVSREIQPDDFAGDPFEVVSYDEEDAGQVEFELYRAVKTSDGRKGFVSISEMDTLYPVTWSEFVRSNRDLLSTDVIDALSSGYFEGVIRAKNVELHPGRNKFFRNNALVGLCVTLQEWFDEVGHKLYQDEHMIEAERRHQQLGLRTADRLKELLRLPGFEFLRNLLQSSPFGTQGSGHVEAGRETGKKTGPSIRTGQGGAGKERNPNGGPRETGGKQGETRPGDVPTSVTGPDGKERDIVRSDSGGLMFVHAPIETSDRLWEFDDAHGIIYFNIRHPVWVMCDRRDSHVLQLQEWIAIQAIYLLAQPKELWDSLRDWSDGMAKAYAEFIIVGGHKRSKRSSA